jgi:hypothetical protein
VIKTNAPSPSPESIATGNLFSEENTNTDKNRARSKNDYIQNAVNESISSEVEKIVFFYKDGTFKVFTPN